MGYRLGLAVAVVLAGTVAGLGGASAQPASKGLIGISLPNKTEARWITDGANLVQSLKDKGYTVDLQYAQYEIPTQLSQLENMLVKQVKLLIIAPIDGTTLTDVIEQAKASGAQPSPHSA